MSATIRILRVLRTDVKNEYLLLHVTQASPTRPLDLKLVATDQEHIYHGLLKGSQMGKVRNEHFAGNEDELRDMLLYALMRERPDGVSLSTLQGLELVAALQKETITLTLRNNIGGITQRIANITLTEDDDREEIGAFDWVDQAVSISDELRNDLQKCQASITTQQEEIDRLKARLEDFVKTKKAHDEDMLIKFAALLNTKKQKIRALTHGRSAVKEDPDAMMEDPPAARNRAAKRKVPDEDDEQMQVDEQHIEDETPEQTEDEASAEDAEDAEPVHATRSYTKVEVPSQSLTLADLPDPIELPFGRRQKQASPPPKQDDEETDDEL